MQTLGQVVIRNAALSDLPSILELEQLCFDGILDVHAEEGYHEKHLQDDTYQYVLAEADDRVIAYITQSKSSWYLICQLAVHPDYRTQGIAQELLDAVLTDNPTWLIVLSNNYPAINLYQRNGFKFNGNYTPDMPWRKYMTREK